MSTLFFHFSVAILISPSVFAGESFQTLDTRSNSHFSELIAKFDDVSFQQTILIDPESVFFNTAVKGFSINNKDDRDGKGELMERFFLDQHQDSLHELFAWIYYKEAYLQIEQALPHGYSRSKYQITVDETEPEKFCVLYPGRRNLDTAEYTKELIYYHPESYQSLYGNEIQAPLSRSEHMLLTDYHEMTHCLDQTYLLKYQEGQVPGSEFFDNRARIELKAEILAILLMVKYEGATAELSRRRSLERYLDSWFRGRSLVAVAFDEFSARGGVTYAFGPALENLAIEIRQIGEAHLRELSHRQLMDVSDTLTEKLVLKKRDQDLLLKALKDPDEALKSDPTDFTQNYIKAVAKAYKSVFNNPPSEEKLIDALVFDQPKLLQEAPRNLNTSYSSQRDSDKATGRLSQTLGEHIASGHSIHKSYSQIYEQMQEQLDSDLAEERVNAMRDIRLLPFALKKSLGN